MSINTELAHGRKYIYQILLKFRLLSTIIIFTWFIHFQSPSLLIYKMEKFQLVVVWGSGKGGLDWDVFLLEWINKVLSYSTRKYIQYPVISHNRKEHEKYVYILTTLLYTRH